MKQSKLTSYKGMHEKSILLYWFTYVFFLTTQTVALNLSEVIEISYRKNHQHSCTLET